MKSSLLFLLCIALVQEIAGPPVTEKKPNDKDSNESDVHRDDEMANALNIEYDRYLREVVSALESDPTFRDKLEKAEEVDIRTGKIAKELEYVNHNVRTKLDELKRQELERLRHLATKEFELENQMDTQHLKISPQHLDHSNPNTFEIEDLRKLIAKITTDLMEADKKRREEFKEYEMQKEFEKQEQLKTLDEENRKKLQHEYEEREKKHRDHKPLHHPGSRPQLEEVWEKQDHMENQEFDPKSFFALHDLDGNGFWDEAEVKALFLKELDKLYNSGAPEDDMRERAEEMERMREHVFAEADVNKDGLISFKEFLAQTQKPEFDKDPGWDSLDQQQIFTHEEYQEFERRRQAEVENMIARGLLPPQPVLHLPPGYQHAVPQYHPQAFQGQGQVHPGQFQQMPHPPQMQGQIHPAQMQGQVPMHPGILHNPQAQGQVQQQMHPGQMPMQPGQPQHPQMQAGQIPHPQVQQNQIPQQAQFQHPQAHAQQAQFQQQQQQQQQQIQMKQTQNQKMEQAQSQLSQPQLNPGVPNLTNNQIPNNPQQNVNNQIPQAHGSNEQNHIKQQAEAIIQQHHQPLINQQN